MEGDVMLAQKIALETDELAALELATNFRQVRSVSLKKLGVELKLVEFVRYADARTALLAGLLDAASVGPADLALAQGSTNVIGLVGIGSSPKYVIGRNGVKFDSWKERI